MGQNVVRVGVFKRNFRVRLTKTGSEDYYNFLVDHIQVKVYYTITTPPETESIGRALEFDGNNDYVDSGMLSNTVSNTTISAWFKSDDAGSIGDDYVEQRLVSQERAAPIPVIASVTNSNQAVEMPA
jgi:hypothetical protein